MSMPTVAYNFSAAAEQARDEAATRIIIVWKFPAKRCENRDDFDAAARNEKKWRHLSVSLVGIRLAGSLDDP